MARRISHARGKGSLNHNNRNHVYKNVNPSKIKDNIYYVKESLEIAYDKCFSQALENYNARQKRSDRKIEDYYKHLFGNANKDTVATSSNKEKSFYEIVVGIGDKNTCSVGSPNGELATKILDEYATDFTKRNPNFYVFNSVIHLDEKTPHLHIDYIPIANGYKNGLETRNSQSVALQQMGFGKNKDSINEWRKQERQILNDLCKKYNLEITEEIKGRGKTFTPDEYKKNRDEAKEELKIDPVFRKEVSSNIEKKLLLHKQNLLSEIDKDTQKLSKLKSEITLFENKRFEEQKNLNNQNNQKKLLQNQIKTLEKQVEGKRLSVEGIKAIKPVKTITGAIKGEGVTLEAIQNLQKTALNRTEMYLEYKSTHEENKTLKGQNNAINKSLLRAKEMISELRESLSKASSQNKFLKSENEKLSSELEKYNPWGIPPSHLENDFCLKPNKPKSRGYSR